MRSMDAIKEFYSRGGKPVENKELMELKKALSPEEWERMGKDCAARLGQPWDPPDTKRA